MNTLTIPDDVMDFIKSIASDSRLQILLLFTDAKELTVNEIAERVNLGQSTTSEHLSNLKRAGILVSRKENRLVFYSANRDRILEVLENLSQILRACCK